MVATPIGNLGDFESSCARDAAELRPDCGRGHAPHRRDAEAFRHRHAAGVAARSQRSAARSRTCGCGCRAAPRSRWSAMRARPAISDPGFELVRAAPRHGLDVIAVPGPCARSRRCRSARCRRIGFASRDFCRRGAAARRARLQALARRRARWCSMSRRTACRTTLADCAESLRCRARSTAVAREITKLHETMYRGSLAELAERAASDADFTRGEIVLVIAGAAPRRRRGADGMAAPGPSAQTLLAELPLKQAARLAAQISGARDNEAYKRALTLKEGLDSREGQESARQSLCAPAHGGKSGLHRARCQVTPGGREPTESATERYRLRPRKRRR